MGHQEFPPSGLRVGHAERDAVAAILQEAAADGRLGMDELDERLDAALRAKTYGDLEPLVADLAAELPWRSSRGPAPAPLPVTRPIPPAPAPPLPPYATSPGPPPAGYSRADPLRLDGGMSTEKRAGAWTVPPYLRISPGAGTIKLNCLQATVAAPVIEVEVIAGAGTVVFIVPEGWAANDDRLGKGFGSKVIKVPRIPAPGAPLLVFYGGVGMGTLKVRTASRRELRQIGILDDLR